VFFYEKSKRLSKCVIPTLVQAVNKRDYGFQNTPSQRRQGRSQWPLGLRYKTVFAGSNAGVVGSSPTLGMDVFVCVYSVCVVLCVGRDLVSG
jgi:hypothetical protein